MKQHVSPMKRLLSLVTVLALLLSLGLLPVYAAEPGDAADEAPARDTEYVFISQTDAKDVELTYYVLDEIPDGTITWTLERIASYANPEDGEFNPLHGEDTMYPNEQDVINLEALKYSTFGVTDVKTEADENSLTLSFHVNPMSSRSTISVPHANGGAYLDVCGEFQLTASVDGKEVDLGKDVIVTVKPYESFRTMWEIYDELDHIAALGDDNAATATPYVVQKSMGQSAAGYDMPYLIIAKDSAAVENWLELCERAETEPEAVIAEIEAGTLDYQVPVVYSNIHSNEVAAVDAVLEFAWMLMDKSGTIDYTKLTGLTDEGQKVLEEQRAALGLHTPELIEDYTSYLGAILPASSAASQRQTSGKVEGFDDYYTSEDIKINVDDLLDDVFFILVPEENVEGRMYVTRTSSGGYDLNRDNSFQTQAETRNMQHLIATYNPVTLVEFHGQVTSYQFEPCSPPHEPNVEYDLLSKHLMTGGEAMGAAAVANNDDWQSYVIPMRDYLTTDKNGDAYWEYPWDDMSTSYTPQFAMLQGCVAYTVEMPAYSESGRIADTYAMVGLSDYVAEEKAGYFLDQLEIYSRCLNNQNTDKEVGPWLVDAYDTLGAEADLFRPAYDGEGENGQFFPECYIIPLDSENQTNLQAAYDMIEWLTRNDVKVGITNKAFTFEDVTYPAGTMIVSMYQAKRAVANGVLYDGTLIRNWTDLYSEGITAFNYTRGFDMVACAQPAAYEVIADAVGVTLDYESGLAYLNANAKSQLTGRIGGDVIISNASEDSTAAVNALLKAGKQVGMITEGEYEGDFICSYTDWNTVSGDYVLSGTGVVNPALSAYVIEKAPTVYISGTANALRASSAGYVYTTLVASSYAYNYDRMAMEMLNFNTTEDASEADAVIGASALDNAGLAAVQNGAAYVGYTSSVVRNVNSSLISVSNARTDGMDCLGTVIYPEKTLVNASYIADGDNVLYGYGLYYFTNLPEGAKILVQRDGSEPMEGFMNGDEESYQAFLNGIQGFSYEGPDMNGNQVNITLFANSLTNKAHQRDEYAFISNAIFASLLTETEYETAHVSSGSSGGSSSAVTYPVSNTTAKTENGTISLDKANAKAGAVVTITASPDAGYEVDAITVTDASGKAVKVTDNGDGTYRFTMPAGKVTVEASFQPVASSGNALPFVDVPKDSWAYDAIVYAYENNLFAGTSATTFGFGENMTRQQMWMVLARMSGVAPATMEAARTWAMENIASDGTNPTGAITREQFVTLLWRYAGSPASSKDLSGYTDFNTVSAYAKTAMAWAVENGIVAGTSATTLSPTATATRAQVAVILAGYYRSVKG